MEIKEDSLYFSVSNYKHINTSLKVADNTGIGINNTRRRLDLLYEDQHALKIEVDKTSIDKVIRESDAAEKPAVTVK